jgi:hypothetical protein
MYDVKQLTALYGILPFGLFKIFDQNNFWIFNIKII